jgi:hypothetical protein
MTALGIFMTLFTPIRETMEKGIQHGIKRTYERTSKRTFKKKSKKLKNQPKIDHSDFLGFLAVYIHMLISPRSSYERVFLNKDSKFMDKAKYSFTKWKKI